MRQVWLHTPITINESRRPNILMCHLFGKLGKDRYCIVH